MPPLQFPPRQPLRGIPEATAGRRAALRPHCRLLLCVIFTFPLSEELYQQLQEETRRQHKPATQLARQAIATWLQQQRETTLHEAIRHYAEQIASTEMDLDVELEAAAIEQLL